MNEFQIVRSMLLHMGTNASAESPIAKALQEWALNNMGWLDLDVRKKKMKEWTCLLEAIQHCRLPEAPAPYVMQLTDGLADILGLEERDHVLLALLIACDRLPRVNALAAIASSCASWAARSSGLARRTGKLGRLAARRLTCWLPVPPSPLFALASDNCKLVWPPVMVR